MGRPHSAERQLLIRHFLECGSWRLAAIHLACSRNDRDWLALGYAGWAEYLSDLGVSKGYASKLALIGNAVCEGAAPAGLVSVTAAYNDARMRLAAGEFQPYPLPAAAPDEASP